MNKSYTTIIVQSKKGVCTVILNRPEVHNAMNDLMIAELTATFKEIGNMENVRLVVLRGNGKSFCAGADLNYMKSIAGYGVEENVKDAKKLAGLFSAIYSCPLPTVALVHGSAFGGANGLLAACDMVIAGENTTFAFSEVKLGIAPATIAPFVIKRIGEFGAKELMITGKRFKGPEAEKWHLVNHAVKENQMEEELQKVTRQIMSNGPEAVKATKQLIGKVMDENKMDKLIDYTARQIAQLRASGEGQEGMAAFLEKRKAKWVNL
ncbi:MAG TPA: enoyl-CoA hydratase/isomerase family protein [Bacteroidetes bacterium]|nr:enoyl-CoA hydratase/isomerase family protein [Bacteroidota bacterium]